MRQDQPDCSSCSPCSSDCEVESVCEGFVDCDDAETCTSPNCADESKCASIAPACFDAECLKGSEDAEETLYPCLWHGCQQSFVGHDDVMKHMWHAHVTAKSALVCQWNQCGFEAQDPYVLTHHVHFTHLTHECMSCSGGLGKPSCEDDHIASAPAPIIAEYGQLHQDHSHCTADIPHHGHAQIIEDSDSHIYQDTSLAERRLHSPLSSDPSFNSPASPVTHFQHSNSPASPFVRTHTSPNSYNQLHSPSQSFNHNTAQLHQDNSMSPMWTKEDTNYSNDNSPRENAVLHGQTHICLWQTQDESGKGGPTCFKTCGSAQELQKHIKAHIIAQKGKLVCMWQNCSRRDGAPFSQKGKLERHMQVHTKCSSSAPAD
jgi:hypothetical protein